MKIIKMIFGACVLSGFISAVIAAEAPVIDYSSGGSDVTNIESGGNAAKSFALPTEQTSSTMFSSSAPVLVNASKRTNLNVEQRIGRLEQQIRNVNAQNLLHRIEELQQLVQKLNGQMEEKQHQIEQLNQQLKSFYQDLNRRLGGKGGDSAIVAEPVASIMPIVPVKSTAVAEDGEIVSATDDSTAKILGDGVKKTETLKPVGAAADSAFLKEQQMYQTAIDLLPDKKYEASESKLRDYLKAYPKGIYVANAHYWLGEINFLQKNFDAAEEEFKIVVDKHAKSKRAADAMLKLALVHQNQGREAQAKQELSQVVKRYPGTSAAQLAKKQLAGK